MNQHEQNQLRCGVVVLVSGRGSNLQAIINAVRSGRLPAEIRAVISSEPGAPALARARTAGIPTYTIDHREFATREQFDQALMRRIDACNPRAVVLAGFMRILGNAFIDHYAGRLINIHPSLLPAFPGLNTHARALQSGASHHGASVHFVTHEVDGGPIIIQAAVPVLPGDTPETLAERVLGEEHRIYPLAIRWFLDGRLSVEGGRVLLDGQQRPEQGLTHQETAHSDTPETG
ncbi:MAG: phosphoribosylglycinamide formyltransferase [Candidatus Muproteobacteria bacterium RIFCSPHIGHO2_12_FULL_60_33]|uniref:Phosphoribosylglycinamide formyltransferase n=1 Tax=Candidatus Muproteobacteria bacterium RIFCSPLOWO2_01_FULL_60_18 TaxID=1817768 RepID=A0A1F6TZF1_9PROT|nr:MAG: phosphoribosylglycinamide formyltransferase [Candidatus Muproteobacteria bacterium RIFCSPHIGHO2_01_60_12]OGI50493.1 MAG: phosphoribosylglycinamide formyltransferase [Candidatus Muproteobacteria bacterium RIFCSPLOWO2_01_FULL_60_18]OGI53476.1 MAG: phosphoribosylglycinamide formyltransferase [Candidatus Muproteobacteria bacterium RIFCSPHIGHO2_12_FULL_60_33]OGI53967.1 MAG: phosphoribosylglycinamide formyltransferase [Candidatus Muproteobacteria bacterium RIFCSPHIGHO2_02_FULL_60_13]